VTVRHSPKLTLYAALTAAGLAIGLFSRNPTLVTLATPAAIFAIAILASAHVPPLSGTLKCAVARAVEGDSVDLHLSIAAPTADRVDVVLPAPSPVEVRAVRPARGTCEIEFTVRLPQWGVETVGPAAVRAWDALGSTWVETLVGRRLTLRVYPRLLPLRSLISARDTLPLAGARRASDRGSGIEYADQRAYVSGDPLRAINWRLSARRGRPYVTVRDPERAADVVLLLDDMVHAGAGSTGTRTIAVRVAGALAATHLREHDRVAIAGVGGGLWWLDGGLGERQLYRIAEALLDSEAAASVAWREPAEVDRRVVPPSAVVVVISPMIARRSIELVRGLRAGGRRPVVIEIAPTDGESRNGDEHLAWRIWSLLRAHERERLRAEGIPVVVLGHGDSLEQAVWEVNRWRRDAHVRWS
jgi:uncharacterized protein (DUF58 family)